MEDPYEKPHITEGELFIWKEDVKPNVGNVSFCTFFKFLLASFNA